MAEYIERRIAINEILTLRDYCFNDEEKHAFSLAYRKLRDAPTADVVEVKHGEWMYKSSSDTLGGTDATYDWMCSVCKDTSVDDTNFCPNCGAKMDGGRKNDGKG